MTMERTDLGCEIEAALVEVRAHVRGETGLPCRIVDDLATSRIVALRKMVAAEPAEIRRSLRLDVRLFRNGNRDDAFPIGQPRAATRSRLSLSQTTAG